MSTEPNRKPRLEIQACYVGGQEAGEKALAPLRHHPTVAHDTIKSRPYLELEQMVPAEIPPSYEEHCSGFFAELDERRIEILANAFSGAPFPVDCFLIHLHGAVTRVPVAATPFPLREDGIACDIAAYWKAPDGKRAASEWIEALKSKLPVDEVGNYVNVMEREEESTVRARPWCQLRASPARQSALRSPQSVLPQPEHTARSALTVRKPSISSSSLVWVQSSLGVPVSACLPDPLSLERDDRNRLASPRRATVQARKQPPVRQSDS